MVTAVSRPSLLADPRTLELLPFLWRGGWGHLWRRPGTSYWINPLELERALARLDDRWATDTYFGVHPVPSPKSTYERARAEDIAVVNTLYADFDDPDALPRIESLQPAPQVVISSGKGFHAYWLLAEPVILSDDAARRDWAEIQRWWVRHVGADPSACDLARLLRVPGTLNAKYDPPRPVRFIRCELDRPHDNQELMRYILDARTAELEREPAGEPAPARPSAGESPIERYNRETNIRDALRQFGYVLVGERYFVRPGKDPRDGISGTIDDSHNRAYTFSSNDPAYDPADTSPSGAGCTLRPFDLLCRLSFGGDAKAAVRWLTQSAKAGQPGPAQNGSAPPAEALPPAAVDALEGQGQDDDLAKFDPDDAGNGDALAHVLGERYLYSEHAGWLRWTGTHYERENAEKLLEAEAVDVLRRRRAAAVLAGKESVVQAAKPSMQRVRAAIARLAGLRVVSIASFDQHPHLLNARNAVIDLRNGQVLAHETSYRFTTCAPVEYDPQADYSGWVNWLSETVRGGDEVLKWLQAWLGYAITGDTSLEQLLYVYGPTRSGKGTLTETLLALMGGLAKTADFASFTKRGDDHQNFDLAALRNARLVVAGEGMRANELNAAKIKLLTGGDEVSCAFKHRDIFTYRPAYKLILVSNHKLNVDVDDDAAWARVRVVEFPNSRLGREDIGLKPRMRQPDTLRAVLAWLVQGARSFYEYLARGQAIPTPETVQAATREHREALDFIGQWMAERLTRGAGQTTARECWQDYSNWCNENGVMHPKGIRAFREALEKRGVIFERTNQQRGVMKGWVLKERAIPWCHL